MGLDDIKGKDDNEGKQEKEESEEEKKKKKKEEGKKSNEGKNSFFNEWTLENNIIKKNGKNFNNMIENKLNSEDLYRKLNVSDVIEILERIPSGNIIFNHFENLLGKSDKIGQAFFEEVKQFCDKIFSLENITKEIHNEFKQIDLGNSINKKDLGDKIMYVINKSINLNKDIAGGNLELNTLKYIPSFIIDLKKNGVLSIENQGNLSVFINSKDFISAFQEFLNSNKLDEKKNEIQAIKQDTQAIKQDTQAIKQQEVKQKAKKEEAKEQTDKAKEQTEALRESIYVANKQALEIKDAHPKEFANFEQLKVEKTKELKANPEFQKKLKELGDIPEETIVNVMVVESIVKNNNIKDDKIKQFYHRYNEIDDYFKLLPTQVSKLRDNTKIISPTSSEEEIRNLFNTQKLKDVKDFKNKEFKDFMIENKISNEMMNKILNNSMILVGLKGNIDYLGQRLQGFNAKIDEKSSNNIQVNNKMQTSMKTIVNGFETHIKSDEKGMYISDNMSDNGNGKPIEKGYKRVDNNECQMEIYNAVHNLDEKIIFELLKSSYDEDQTKMMLEFGKKLEEYLQGKVDKIIQKHLNSANEVKYDLVLEGNKCKNYGRYLYERCTNKPLKESLSVQENEKEYKAMQIIMKTVDNCKTTGEMEILYKSLQYLDELSKGDIEKNKNKDLLEKFRGINQKDRQDGFQEFLDKFSVKKDIGVILDIEKISKFVNAVKGDKKFI